MKRIGWLIAGFVILQSSLFSQNVQESESIQSHPSKLGVLIRRQMSLSNRLRVWNYYFNSRAFGQYRKYKSFSPSKEWQLTFSDQFDSFNHHKWRRGQPWGLYHPSFPHQYYSDSSIYTKNGLLYLQSNYRPKSFKIGNRDTSIPFGVGLLITDTSFKQKYGYFEIRSKNPSGPATWPAFWLTGYYSWPPEIDIFEMYGKRKGARIHHRQTNIHWGVDGKKSRGELINGNKLPANTDSLFHTYACDWSPKAIKFYTDGILTRKVKLNKKMRHWFNQPMVLVVNNAIDHRYLKYLDNNKLPNQFIVDFIKVYQNINYK